MHEPHTRRWYTPATAAMGDRYFGRTLRLPDDLDAIGEQYSPTAIWRFRQSHDLEPHFKLVQLCELGELLGKGTRYVLEVSFAAKDLAGEHELRRSYDCSDVSLQKVPCVQELLVNDCLDITRFRDLRALVQGDSFQPGSDQGARNGRELGRAVLALGAYEVYLQACDEFPKVFDRMDVLRSVAQAGDPANLAAWIDRLSPDLDVLASMLRWRTAPHERPLLATVYANRWQAPLAPRIAGTLMDSMLAQPVRADAARYGAGILATLADALAWTRLPEIARRFASRDMLTEFLALHWGRHWPAFDAATAMETLTSCYEQSLPDVLWHAITNGGDAAFTAAALVRFPPADPQQLRILANAQYERADGSLTILDPTGARRAQLSQWWQVETPPTPAWRRTPRNLGKGLRTYVKAMEQGDLEEMRALEAEGVDASAYHVAGLRLARRHGHIAVELHLLGALTRRAWAGTHAH